MQTVPLRLLRTYRGYRRGEVIRATTGLAELLVAAGTAERVAEDRTLPGIERAVESVTIETR